MEWAAISQGCIWCRGSLPYVLRSAENLRRDFLMKVDVVPLSSPPPPSSDDDEDEIDFDLEVDPEREFNIAEYGYDYRQKVIY